MSRDRKPIPPPIQLNAPRLTEANIEEAYKIPFMIAEGPRLMLNFLALSSNLPEAYRNMISQWLHGYNEELMTYLASHYGPHAVVECDLIAKKMFEGFVGVIREEREAADAEMFSGLDRDIFGDNGLPE
ncbi:hypothetical protein [Mycobacterium sp. AZCC_0083]|uniref:hypothetical protein n=1 Tax=Mycobacterium sp. AZCC_0083 TaxID=2735882 RepID=UPI00161A2232|nr:hypothetical protein [Mycobacterium sp. AZCC_0083]MBB5167160.1 hypothetical protein [Mycobacterium sp. AZCC_0083]